MNLAGTIATVPNNDDDPDSFRSAFAINVGDNPEYDFDQDTFFGRTVFGRIEAGLDVAAAISRVAATEGVPVDSPLITTVYEIAAP
jgi:cyclophilin family peptidyl-prolyl cis-trans isomerase